MLKSQSILGAGMALFFFVMACTQGVSFAGDAYNKSRAKALSNVSERYNYYKVDDPTDLVVTKDILKLQKQPRIGLDARKFRGYAPTLNYGEVSNMHLPDRVSIATPFRSKGLVGKPQGYGENLGTLTVPDLLG